jgi:hypothetical protein
MNGAMNPAILTKPAEYPVWKSFYESTFAPVNKAIQGEGFQSVRDGLHRGDQKLQRLPSSDGLRVHPGHEAGCGG